MEAKFSPRVKDVITYSKEEAVRLNNDFIGVEHLLIGIIRLKEGMAIKILNEYQIDLEQIKLEIEDSLSQSSVNKPSTSTSIPLLKQAEKIIKMTYLEAKHFRHPEIGLCQYPCVSFAKAPRSGSDSAGYYRW